MRDEEPFVFESEVEPVTRYRPYPQVTEDHPAFELVRARRLAGLEVCDSADHNTGCTNPDCPVWGAHNSEKEQV